MARYAGETSLHDDKNGMKKTVESVLAEKKNEKSSNLKVKLNFL